MKPINNDDDFSNQRLQDTFNGHEIIVASTTTMLSTVGKMLIENKATLLPIILQDFVKYAKSLAGSQELSELKLISSKVKSLLVRYRSMAH